MSKNRIAIVGGGIGGLTLAVALQKNGFDVKVYENTPQWKPLGAGLGLAGNAIRAFREIGIDRDVMAKGKVLQKMLIKTASGKVLSTNDSERISQRFGVVNNFAIHRADLHEVLLSHLTQGTVELNKRCIDFSTTSGGVRMDFSDGTTAEADYVLASDGIHSVFRKKLVPASGIRYSGYTCWRAIATAPPDVDFSTTTESWGSGTRFGVVPLTDGKVYWFACKNAPQNDPVMRNARKGELESFFEHFHQPIPQLLEATKEEEIIWGDIIDLRPLDQFAFGRIALMGDAAHATTPNLGQGACMAIEDAVVIANLLKKGMDPEGAFRQYETMRVARTKQIVTQSWRIGQVAQWQNPFLVNLRNALMQLTPASATEKQLKFIYEVDLASEQ